MKLPIYLSLLAEAEHTLAESFRQVADSHGDEPDVHLLCQTLASQCDAHRAQLTPVMARYGPGEPDDEPDRLHADALGEPRTGPLGLLRDLQDLYLLANFTDISWTMVKQAAEALRDTELLSIVTQSEKQTAVQLQWLKTRMKQSAPQALIAAK
jgi:hypothetical protein